MNVADTPLKVEATDLAKMLGCSRATVFKLLKSDPLAPPSWRVGRRRQFYYGDCLKYVKARAEQDRARRFGITPKPPQN